MDFFTSPTFIAVVIGFGLFYVFQVSFKGPQEADRQKRIDEFVGRLSEDARSNIENLLAAGDKLGAIKMFREETNVGLAEAKESIVFLKKEMEKRV